MLLLQIIPSHVTTVLLPAVERPLYEESDFWVAIVTFLLMLVTAWLAIETRKLRKDGAEGVKAAIKGAAAASDNAEIARKSMTNTLRAYIVVKEIRNEREELMQIPTQTTVRILNTGQTPSQNQYCFCKVDVFAELPVRSEFEDKPPRTTSVTF